MLEVAEPLNDAKWPLETVVRDNFLRPRNTGTLEPPAHTACAASVTCGAAIRMSLKVDESNRITEIRYQAAGCSVLVAAASNLTEAVKGMTTGQAAASARLLTWPGGVPAGREECVLLACNALLEGIKQFSDSVRDEWVGDEALICTCFGVSEKTIQRHVRLGGFERIEEVTKACNAGAGCRSCWPLIQDILDEPNYATATGPHD